MPPQILNVDILDDKEPHILVQKYIYPDRTFQVFRKSTSPDEQFAVSPGIEIDSDLIWPVSILLLESADDLDEDLDEFFATVYLDEDNPPTYDANDLPQAEEYLNISYDSETQLYHCESPYTGYETLDSITAPTLDEAIAHGIDELHTILAAKTATSDA